MEYIFSSGKIGIGLMNKQTLPIVIMAVCLVPIDRQKREQTDKLQALSKYVGKGYIICAVVIRIQCKHTAGQSVHHVAAGCLHNNISYKAGGERAVFGKQCPEIGKLLLIRQFVK